MCPKLLCFLAAFLLGACAAQPHSVGREERTKAGVAQQHGECLVCKHNADLACVDVAVDKDTPRYTYNGTTYFFCSDQCKKEFAAAPEKYIRGK